MGFGMFAGNKPKTPARGGGSDEKERPAKAGESVLAVITPWLLSLAVHAVLVLLAFSMVWSYLSTDQKEPIVPVARLGDDPGGRLERSQPPEARPARTRRRVVAESLPAEDTLSQPDVEAPRPEELMGLAAADRKERAPFAMRGGGAADSPAKFYGVGGNARKIIYLVDASGSLIDTLAYVILELKRSIQSLSPRQRFTVIFFQKGGSIEAPPAGWKRATARMKERVADWITLDSGNVVPRGSTDPLPAIRLAMSYQPQLLFILSDNISGRGSHEVDPADLLATINRLDADRKVKINTIQFLYPDPQNTLRKIAQRHGGVYRFIRESDLGLE